MMITARTIIALSIAIGCFCFAGCQPKNAPESAEVATAPQPLVISETEAVASEPQQSGPSAKTPANHVICYLKMRDKLITIRTGSDGPLYTVKSENGEILAVDLDLAELSAQFPELKDVVERGFADWAGNDIQHYGLRPSTSASVPAKYPELKDVGKQGFADWPANDLQHQGPRPSASADLRSD